MGFEPRTFECRPNALPTQPPTLIVERSAAKINLAARSCDKFDVHAN